ncbi:MAG: DUF1284 domain-containing protein [Oscillibacter sp.]|nr:DUF1284 domain-containing protein [Oscillibacter sp.]
MSGSPLPLRPHHGMCMAYFVGHGYSGGFTAHMARLLETLTPETPVRLTVDTDAVCGPCPNNRGGLCDKPELVAGWDREVLRLCGLEENQILPFGAFTALVQERILAPGLRSGICGSCQWNEICAAHPSRWA